MKCTVVNIRDDYDVYIGRPSKWGNPFVIGRDGTREEVINSFRVYATVTGLKEEAQKELKGKRLGCYCAPLACHGDILAEWANGPLPGDSSGPQG